MITNERKSKNFTLVSYRSTTSSNLSSSCIRDHCSHKPKATCLKSKNCKVLLREYSVAMSIFTIDMPICLI